MDVGKECISTRGLRRAACALVFAGMTAGVLAQGMAPQAQEDPHTDRTRAFILSDIGNEPADQMSLVRLLLYSNEIDIEGLVATTSTWQRSAVHPETIHSLVEAYGGVRENLMLHAKGWPTAQELEHKISSGQPAYGLAATGPGKNTAGSSALVQAADRADERPLWVLLWGGANTLAQALLEVCSTRTPAELQAFVRKLRVYSISDQDDAGAWARKEFPDLSYIAQPSTQDGADYPAATWTGISGDLYYRNGAGADASLVTNEWLDAHIRSKGPLGKVYPKYLYIMEGDTPSFLNLLANGLESYRSPDWGGWGGRYTLRQPSGEPHLLWTQGGAISNPAGSRDTVTGVDGLQHTSDQATIWRWREAYQNDFAARMQWTIADYKHANHAPEVAIDSDAGTSAIVREVRVGETLEFDASASHDPDGQKLHYHWFRYAEAGGAHASLGEIALQDADSARVRLEVKATCRPGWISKPDFTCPTFGVSHVIVAVSDDGEPRLTSYRRIVLKIHGASWKPVPR